MLIDLTTIAKKNRSRRLTWDHVARGARRLCCGVTEYHAIRNYKIWWLRQRGWTYAKIGRKFSLSRSRTTQIIFKMERRRAGQLRRMRTLKEYLGRDKPVISRLVGVDLRYTPQSNHEESQCLRGE